MKELIEQQNNLISETQEDKNVDLENKAKLFALLKNGWDAFHRYFVYILIASLLGVFVGVKASTTFYSDKMADAITAGAFVFKGKPFTINPK
jgi:hypothetical protein